MTEQPLPPWAEEIRATYKRGESSVFVLAGNVYDRVLHKGDLTPVIDFLANDLLAKKDIIVTLNPATGVKVRKKEQPIQNLDELIGVKEHDQVLAGLEKLLRSQDGVGVIIDYAEMIAPRGDTSFLTTADRNSVVTLHRWSLDRHFENSDNVVILVTEALAELNAKLVGNPRITIINVPLPDEAERKALIRLLDPEATSRDVEKLASLSAGLKSVQIRGILAPAEEPKEDRDHRYESIREMLGDQKDAMERAKKLTRFTAGMTWEQTKDYLRSEGVEVDRYQQKDASRYDDVFALLNRRKREIIEKECLGTIEFVEPHHDFSAVGGMDEVKRELMQIAHNIREGNRKRVPMGLLFVGPMGTGKTFVAEAFARSSGLTAIKLKNFRSKWVGSTESNLETILSVVKAIGNILVIIDEGDRAFGNTSGDGDGDGGTSSRVIARIKEFMSDTTNRGRVLFVLMTNRPDKLDIDIKRAGRLDTKIPFFYNTEPEDIEPIIGAQIRRHHIPSELEFPRDRATTSARLAGYSNADVEAVVLLANNIASREGAKVTASVFERAFQDYLPSRDQDMLEYMELLAVFESSSRGMLPKRYRDIALDDLQERMRLLRMKIR
jgi:SpoVK/Ycf46/Vps4 family AAA+-type ATPase